MKKEFIIENGALIKYEGKNDEVVIPDEVTVINSYAIRSAKKVVLNSNCKKICKHAIGDLHELIIPSDSKLSIIESNAIGYGRDTIPIVLPDGIKVLNEGMPPIANLPKKLQTIKRFAFLAFEDSTKNIIYYLPETLKKIEHGLNGRSIYITKNNKPLDGWNIESYEIDNVVFNVADETIYEDGEFKYVICKDENGPYVAIVSIPLKPFVFIPEKIKDYFVKVVCFAPDEVESNKIIPALYVSKYVFQISYLWGNHVLIGDEFNEKITSNKGFAELEESGNVRRGIKREEIKYGDNFYYISKPEGITLLSYDGVESKVVYSPDKIDGEDVTDVVGEAFQFLQGKVDFIKYPGRCKFPRWSKVMHDNHSTIMVNKHIVFDEPTINPCFIAGATNECSAEIVDYAEQNGFKMIHIKDVDEEGYVIIDLDRSVKEKQIMNPPTKVNNLKVLGISWRLLQKDYMNSEMAKRYYSIYKKLY